MGEVQDELDRGALETGVAHIDADMVLRDAYRASTETAPALREYRAPSRSFEQLRIRLHTDPIHGPHWLTLLAVCAYLRGVLVVSEAERGPDLTPPLGV